jgi:esterase/lipase superfamily enzyme
VLVVLVCFTAVPSIYLALILLFGISEGSWDAELLVGMLVAAFVALLCGALAFRWTRSRRIQAMPVVVVAACIAVVSTIGLFILWSRGGPTAGSPAPDGAAPAPSLPPPSPPPSYQDFAALDSAPMGVKVYYGTDRLHTASTIPGRRYSGRAADSLQLGTLVVNVPSYRHRAVGEINRPPLIRSNPLWNRPSAKRDMFIVDLSPMDSASFFGLLSSDVVALDDALVFVHGYNVSFEEAALRVAQLAADLNYPGVPILYSWASRGKTVGYVSDQANARNSGAHLARFLRAVRANAKYARINIVTHSMGAEVFAKALMDLKGEDLHLDQIVLIAPDLDVRPFRREILPLMREKSERVTVYASNEDRALQASRALNGVWRLGLGGDSLVVLRYLDTVDATRVRTDFLGHGSFGSTAFLEDLFGVLVERRATPRRLLRVPRGELAFYRFRTVQH